ncbi:MAG: M14 family metallopeptidase [Phycisphaerae bacterium]
MAESTVGCASRGGSSDFAESWRTFAEAANYEESPTYDETVAYAQRLAKRSPWVRYAAFGESARGREMPLLVLSKHGDFSAAKTVRSELPTVLIINCIHAGECAGKDASLALARDIAIEKSKADLLDSANLLIVPIYNVDGHERRSAHSRINQNGPREMGWRTTATNLNLNRDFAKADAVETQALLRLIRDWQPDVIVDAHTTNGSDHQYDMLYGATLYPPAGKQVVEWTRAALTETILPQMKSAGYPTMIYAGPRERDNLASGLQASVDFSPRYSTGYGAVLDRPTFLLEAHALKPYARRVVSSYEMMAGILRHANKDGAALRAMTRAIDRDYASRNGADDGGAIVLESEITDVGSPFEYLAKRSSTRPSELTGGDVIVYEDQPDTVATTMYDKARVTKAMQPRAAYVMPPEWTNIAARLMLHGIEVRRVTAATQCDAQVYRFSDVSFPPRTFEGRTQPVAKGAWSAEQVEVVAGSFLVPMNQPRAKLAAHLLEPEAPDSFLAWGFFNAIFERKEYAESYVFEPIAAGMLKEDAALRAEYEEKVKSDAAFAGNPRARLYFLYDRSAYRDAQWMLYPVVRVEDDAARAVLVKESVAYRPF